MKLPILLPSKRSEFTDLAWTALIELELEDLDVSCWLDPLVNPIDLVESRLLAGLIEADRIAAYEHVDHAVDVTALLPEDLTVTEVQNVRALALNTPLEMVQEFTGLDAQTVDKILDGTYAPLAGGKLHPNSKTGLLLERRSGPQRVLVGTVYQRAAAVLPPDLFEILCHQNGHTTDEAYTAIAELEPRNDQQDRVIYRNFICRVQGTNPGKNLFRAMPRRS